ncbi:MAG: glycosyltransferase [Bacteroidota bacterium]
MKILHILNRITYSGAEVMLKDAAQVFHKNGFESHVLSTGEDIGNYAPFLEKAGYVLHHIPFRKSPLYFLSLFLFLRREKFEVVHIHPERAFFWHALTARLSGCKRILRSVLDVFLFSGYLRQKRKLQRRIARKFFGVEYIAIGESVKNIEQELFSNPTVIIKDWIDESILRQPTEQERMDARLKFDFKGEDVVVISVGTCNEKKNHYAIFRAIQSLKKSGHKRVKYLHRGTGPTRAQEMEYAKELGIDNDTMFLDFIDDVREAYWASDIFVMTSSYEGLGNVILEAMNCGLPVLLYNVLGMRDTLPEGKGGILVEPCEIYLISALKQLIENPDIRIRMGKEAFESIRKNFSMAESLAKLIVLYKKSND